MPLVSDVFETFEYEKILLKRNFSIKDSETVVNFQKYDKDSVKSFFDQPVVLIPEKSVYFSILRYYSLIRFAARSYHTKINFE
jgi:hypothetical protein